MIKKSFDRKKFIKPIRWDKYVLFVLIIRSFFWGMQGWVIAIMMKDVITALENNNLESFFWSVAIIFVISVLAVIPNYFFRNNNEKFFRWLQSEFYNTYISKYLQLDNNITDSLGTWQLNNIIQKWWDNRSSLLSNMIWSWSQVVLRILTAMMLFIIYTWWKWFFIVFCFFIVSFLIAQYWNKKMVSTRKEMREYYTQADKDIVRLIMSKSEVIQSNKSFYELNKISKIFDEILQRKYKVSYRNIFAFDIQKGWILLLQVILILYIWYGVYQWEYSLWLLSMCWMLSNQINFSVQDLNDTITQFYSQIIYVEKLRETFDDAPMIKWYDTGKNFIYKEWDIVLENITYDYGKGEVLKNFSLTIQWWKKTALVGISGSGKSTLIKLIAWYIHPQSGKLSIDNQSLPNDSNTDYISLQSYYKHIWYLTQEPNVFDGSIYENLTYALENSTIDEDSIRTIIESSQCQFIYNFPEWIHTHIWEKWIKLSWWQRQRLAIAKIMLKNPQIILLDEPTSALDSFSEEEVTKALENLFQWKTVIIIAHRLQTVKKADEIIVLEWWKIVEKWSHNQLVKYWWQYAKMLELQSGF